MFTVDGHTPRARRWLAENPDRLILSDWTLTEFSSAVAVGMRATRLTAADAARAEAALSIWLGRAPPILSVEPMDVREARRFIRAISRPLRAGDALHLAIAQRMGCSVATFDTGMRAAAEAIGLATEAV